MEATKGYILLVENDEDVRIGFAKLLNLEGYLVYSFATREEAIDCCQGNPVDLALIDYRLKDDMDPNDDTGLHLAEELDCNLVKILMSAFGPNLFGIDFPPNTRQFDKNRGAEGMVDLVNQLFEDEVQVNHDLIIHRDNDLHGMLSQTKKYRYYNRQVQNRQRLELVGLFERLFYYEKEIRLKYIQPGYGGSGVVRVTPFYASGMENGRSRGADVIVKFGEVENMQREFDRYSRYVETFLGMRATDVVGSMKISGSLAGIKFRLIGSQSDWNQPNDVKSFEETFQNPSVSDAEIGKIIEDLFENTCHLWYAGKYQSEHKPSLASAYKQHFNLDTDERLTEVEEIIDGLVDRGDENRLIIKHVSPYHLEFDFNNNFKSPCILMNPLVMIERFPEHLPPVYYWSISHGDLNERNIFVDETHKTWLIDFFKTGEGPALRDVIQLETSIKFFMNREKNLLRRLAFEWYLLAPEQFSDTGYLQMVTNGNERVANAIASLRNQATAINGDESMHEYYAGMLFNTLRVMTLESLDPELSEAELRIRRKHALFSAAVLADKFSGDISQF